MSNRIFKNNSINFGDPYKIETSGKSFIQPVDEPEDLDAEEDVEENAVEDSKKESKKIIKDAKEKAKEILDKAKADADSLGVKTKKDNEKIGYDAGMKKIQAQKKKLLKESETLKKETENLYEETAKKMEGEIIKVVFDVVEKILNYEVDKNDAYILGSIQKALYKTNDREGIRIKVSLDDFEFLDSNKKQIYNMVEGLNELQILKDDNLKKGDCLVETIYGTIDISIKKQLEGVKRAFNTIIELDQN